MTAEQKHIRMLIKLAHDYPQLQDHLLPVIQQQIEPSVRMASLVKKAFKSESEQFVAWCLMKNDKLTAQECQRVLDRIGVPLQEEGVKQTRGPLEKGEMVRCDAKKNTNPLNTEVCERRHDQVGNVVDVDGNALVVEFTDGLRTTGTERFDGKDSGAKTGLYRHTPAGAGGSDHRALVEVIYISDKTAKPPTKERVEQIQEYIANGMGAGESRSRIFYSGLALKQAMGKNGYYFTIFSAQRDQYPTSINPAKGQVLYIGLLGHRPGGWKNEFARMMSEKETPEDK